MRRKYGKDKSLSLDRKIGRPWIISNIFSFLTLYHTIPTFNDIREKAFKNIVGKGENAGGCEFDKRHVGPLAKAAYQV